MAGSRFGEDVEAEVAAGLDPFVMLFGQDGADEADKRVTVGEDTNDISAAPDFLVEPFFYPALVGRSIRCGSDFSGRGGEGGQ